jgi:tetratricopeptide (TPR) repeat protein
LSGVGKKGGKTSRRISEQPHGVDVLDVGAYMSEYPKNHNASAEGHNSQPGPGGSAEVVPVDRESLPGEQDFEQELDRARSLLENSDLEGAFRLLQNLEAKYISASSLFNLLGDVLIRKGDVEQGLHYKQLHQVLNKTLQIARGAVPKKREAAVAPIADLSPSSSGLEQDFPDMSYAPVTAAMAHELMRQGHFDKAAQILNILLQQNPEDGSLKEILDEAAKKGAENRILRTLGGWLNNIKDIKANWSVAE